MKLLLTTLVVLIVTSNGVKAQDNFVNYFNQGIQNFEDQNYNKAATNFSQAIKNKTSETNSYKLAGAYMQRALCYNNMGKKAAAMKDIETALLLKPEFANLYAIRAQLHLVNKEYNDVIIWADKGLALKNENEELMLYKTNAYYGLKNYQKSIEIADSVLAINSSNTTALKDKGDAYTKLKDFTKAVNEFSKVIAIEPQGIGAFYNRGIAYARNMQFKEALADTERAMQIDSNNNWIGYNNIAYFIKFEEKDYKGALAYFDKSLKINPKFDYAYNNRGFAKLQLNDLKGARTDIKKSIALNATNCVAYRNLALILIAEKKEKKACIPLNKANELGYSKEYNEDVNDLLNKYCVK